MNKRSLLSFLCIVVVQFFMTSCSKRTVPSEVVVLRLPEVDGQKWQEIQRRTSTASTLVEYIPANQQVDTWKDMVQVHFMNVSRKQLQLKGLTPEMFAQSCQDYVKNGLSNCRGNMNTISASGSECVTESILVRKNELPQYAINRMIFKNEGIHCVNIIKRDSDVTPQQKKEIVSMLNGARFVDINTAEQMGHGLSVLDRTEQQIVWNGSFQGWERTEKVTAGTDINERWEPAEQRKQIFWEILDVTSTQPDFDLIPLNRLVGAEKNHFEETIQKKLEYTMLKERPEEVIFCFSYPYNENQVISMCRLFKKNCKFFCLRYRRAIQEKLSESEVKQLQRRLEAISIQRVVNAF